MAIFESKKQPNSMYMESQAIQNEIKELESQLTGDLFADMEIKDKIHNLTMQLNGVKPMDSHFDCIGCGS